MGSIAETIIIIPAYNEGKKIAGVLDKINEYAPDADVLVVDDCSTDDTARVVREQGAFLVSLPINLGYGSALETGYKYALKEGYKYVLHLDADGQHEPKCIPDLLDEIKSDSADLIIGSRFLVDCGYKTTFAKRIGTGIFATIASIITGTKVTDPNSGFQAMNRDILKFYASGLYPEDYPDADMIILLNVIGFRLKEIPVVMYSNTETSMHSGIIRPLYYIFKMSLSILMVFLRKGIYKSEKAKL